MNTKPYLPCCANRNPVVGSLLDMEKPVEVYRNLTNRCWSVRQGGIGRLHTTQLALRNCTFKVSEAGRQRVLRDRRKNVHAFVRGRILPWHNGFRYGRIIRYNPYSMETFETLQGEPCLHLDAVSLSLMHHGHGICEILEG